MPARIFLAVLRLLAPAVIPSMESKPRDEDRPMGGRLPIAFTSEEAPRCCPSHGTSEPCSASRFSKGATVCRVPRFFS